MLIELGFAMVVNYEHICSFNADDRIGPDISFVSFADDLI